jgi:hypothetical protein
VYVGLDEILRRPKLRSSSYNFVSFRFPLFHSQPGWPTNYEALKPFIPYNGTNNTCKDCSSRRRGVCKDHKQSPIPLNRNVTATRECIDRHLMKVRSAGTCWSYAADSTAPSLIMSFSLVLLQYGTGQCHVDDMKFQILPHVLRTYQPNRCPGQQPNIDFSMGFPYPWLLKFTDITIPSHHMQDGKRYDAEVVLTHAYSKNNPKKMVRSDNQLEANVVVLLLGSSTILTLLPFSFSATRLGTWQSFSSAEKNRITTTFWSCTSAIGGRQQNESAIPAQSASVAMLPKRVEVKVSQRGFGPPTWSVTARRHPNRFFEIRSHLLKMMTSSRWMIKG